MTLDELVGNLKTYEMNVDKRAEGNKEKKSNWHKATESDESDIDNDDLTQIRRNFKKFLKRGLNSRKKTSPTKEKIVERPQDGGCIKCGKIDHQIKDYPMWEVEWKKERAEKEKKKLLNKKNYFIVLFELIIVKFQTNRNT